MKKISFLLLLLSIMLWSCSKDTIQEPDDEKPDTEKPVALKNMVTGPLVDAASGTIALTGGKIKVTTAGSPVNGLEIDIPDSSFTAVQSFKISYSEIKSHQLGAHVNPVSPLIKITTDAGYSQQIMRITIPVNYPSGSIPIGFFYDETTGKLEGIPFESVTANSITLLTRHLMPPSKLKSGISEKSAQAESFANILISSISETLLNALPVISSGFKPGIDDWEFANYGSYTAIGGHCAGQNMTSMWYYFEKKPTMGGLFNKFSDNSILWEDNARGYRFCSVIHKDLDWEGNVTTLFEKYIDKNQELDKLKLLTIAGAMLVTGEPQGIGIYRMNGLVKKDGTPKYSGHDLICYQVSVSGGKLYISDPNTPGAGQTIDFANNKFMPYTAKLNGHDSPKSYPFVTYYAKTAYIEWDKIGKRWDELVSKTIGNVAPNTFPNYTIWVKDNINEFELKDGMTVTEDILKTYVECPTAITAVTLNGKRIISSKVYNTDGLIISEQNVPGVTNWSLSTGLNVKLAPGLNQLGYSIVGWNPNKLFEKSTENIPLFIDFKWINVYYTKLKISPNPIIGAPGKEITITAKSYGSAPKNAKYVWNFGDGTADVTVLNDSIIKYKYPKVGNFNVVVNLYDNTTNKLVGTSTAMAKINQLITKFGLYFQIGCHTKVTSPDGTTMVGSDLPFSLNLKEIPCVQNGNIINASWDGNYSGFYHKGNATFTLKSDHTVSFTVSDIYTGEGGGFVQSWSATSNDVPFIKDFVGVVSYLEYGVPESFYAMQKAYMKSDYTLSKGGITESTGIYNDTKSGVKTPLDIKFYY